MEDAIAQAITPQNELSLRQIAAEFDVNRTTLQRRLAGLTDRHHGHIKQQKLLTEEENTLTGWVKRLCEWKWVLSFSILQMNAKTFIWVHLLDWQGSLDEKWAECFLNHFFGLSTAWLKTLNNSRIAAAQKNKILNFFHSILKLCTKFSL